MSNNSISGYGNYNFFNKQIKSKNTDEISQISSNQLDGKDQVDFSENTRENQSNITRNCTNY